MKKLIVFISAAIVLISCQTNYKKSLEIDQIFENYYQESLLILHSHSFQSYN